MPTNRSRRTATRLHRFMLALATLLIGSCLSVLAANASTQAAEPALGTVDPLAFVDPELRPAAQRLLQMTIPPLTEAALPERRAAPFGPRRPLLANVSVAERKIPGVAAGAPAVRLYVINAASGEAKPAILHTHGGGYILGSAEWDLRDLQSIAIALDCVVVTVDYRLAPETNYAGSIEDNYAGLRWLYGNSAELGVDRRRIAVMGESAGGGHAALLALVARDRGEVPLLFQMLVYPMLDDRTGSTQPVPPHVGAIGWNADANRFGWRAFLGQAPGGEVAPPGSVPARVEDLRRLPPTFIGVGGLDLFVNEDIEYARRLIRAGVPTELLVIPGAFHGFDLIARDAAVSRRFTEAKISALKRAFATAGTAPAPTQLQLRDRR